MCGRYILTTPAEALREIFRFIEQPNLPARYNIAPTTEAPVVRQRREPTGERTLQSLRWGLVPPWAGDLSGGAKMITARGETAHEKPAFRKAFAARRCLVPADGFYEWQETGAKAKQPMLIVRRDRVPIAFAGLWERWWPKEDNDDKSRFVDTFTIVTTDANDFLKPLHHRMPVILSAQGQDLWLDPDAPAEALRALVQPAANDLLAYFPVDPRASNVRNDDPSIIDARGPMVVWPPGDDGGSDQA